MSAELNGPPSTSPLCAADIDSAAERIAAVVTPTPLQFSDRLSAITGAQVYLKREDLQIVRSYKLRGAYNLLVQLSDEEIGAGVVCSSAGNHAQGFAYACRVLGVHGRVYVPAKTPKQKRDRIRYHGGSSIELIVGGSTYDLAADAALEDTARTGATLVPPYDDPRTIAGQGTIAVEVLDQLNKLGIGEPGLVVVPVGGGGCIAGITTYLAERTDNTAVLGIEPAGAAAMMAALAAGEPVTLSHVDQFVDGAAVNRAGTLTHAALAAAGDMVSITAVDEGAVCTAMLDLYQNEGIIAEPAGALSVAGLLEAEVEPGSTVVCLISGGNNDVSRYGEVLERSLVHLGLKHYFLVDFPQEPGSLRRFLDHVLGPNDDVTLFEYVKRNNRETGEALVGIQLGSSADLDDLLVRMCETEIHIEKLQPGSPAYRYLLL
ncbi:threonine ammonia-lyase [Mycobacterium montefiorense]|uniref:L-threonine dehydratase n=1 Tax=Mycobacterium montefiorense TaxID=154654 RepID=A0AA37UMY1_9MYCO|nr:threonine ammonia-lyase [Mycobacterium montefiorense]GBG38530.1 L-threonine dehydratase biosynthetic IlvA [Mycobacterium montefiorense]GKU34358.1 L-threonine dehydratase biosynthetic IlvA [Mycobacterium montefiorense]GKU38979.1 L-threonine dehydratase biosynthetic IlvA [Mycobacterium montefiorense]GKU47983.1 L-threonine dehydratase biosynthetic IlvA [Mycobacterium montefiorense]GKU49744.1 L-threonine dehydratase biosynthetic IlvA [Mycobacterium montefiorense]